MTMTPGQKQKLEEQVGQQHATQVAAPLVAHTKDGDDTLFFAQPASGGKLTQRYVDSDGPPGNNDDYLGLEVTLGIEGIVTQTREVDNATAELKIEAENGDWAWVPVTVDRNPGELLPEEQAEQDAHRARLERAQALRSKRGRTTAENAELIDLLTDLTLGT